MHEMGAREYQTVILLGEGFRVPIAKSALIDATLEVTEKFESKAVKLVSLMLVAPALNAADPDTVTSLGGR